MPHHACTCRLNQSIPPRTVDRNVANQGPEAELHRVRARAAEVTSSQYSRKPCRERYQTPEKKSLHRMDQVPVPFSDKPEGPTKTAED